jgi:hypothetical protein
MSGLINFVRHRRKLLSKKQQQDYKLFRFSLMAIGGILVLMLIVLGVRFSLSLNLTQIKAQQDQLRQSILGLEENEKNYVIFSSKVKALVELFDERRNKQEAISFFSSAFDNRVLVSDITYDAMGSMLTFGLVSQDVFTMETVYEMLQSPEVKAAFEQIKMSDMRRSADGSYRITVTVILKGA